jgi:hypothetical protein
MGKTISHFFPDLFDRLARFSDPRKRREYSVSELITAGIALFLLKEGSRNAMNLDRKEKRFCRNYYRVFGQRLPQMDAVEDLFRELKEEELSTLKAAMIGQLMEKKVLRRFRVLGRSFNIAVDATHVASYTSDYCGECLSKQMSEKKTVYMHYVLEAKLVTSSGLSLSVCSEWIANTGKEYDKQDCERKSFARLAVKLKVLFPRLPICITADGLYPNAPFFKICEQNRWDYIVTFKDGNLPSVWEELRLLPPTGKEQATQTMADRNSLTQRHYRWRNGIDYNGHMVNWIECMELVTDIGTGEVRTNKFVHLTNLNLDSRSAPEVSRAGRLRWKIENEGFNTQKNHGYGLGHKFSRVSFNAMKNYYQCLQIAHIINQLLIHSSTVADLMKMDGKLTVRHLWKKLISFMDAGNIDPDEWEILTKRRCQIRLA